MQATPHKAFSGMPWQDFRSSDEEFGALEACRIPGVLTIRKSATLGEYPQGAQGNVHCGHEMRFAHVRSEVFFLHSMDVVLLAGEYIFH